MVTLRKYFEVCREKFRHKSRKFLYQLRERALPKKPVSRSGILHMDEQNFFKIVVVSDFWLNCEPGGISRTWKIKHGSNNQSLKLFQCHTVYWKILCFSPNLTPMTWCHFSELNCTSWPKIKAQMTRIFLPFETSIRSKLAQTLLLFDDCRSHWIDLQENWLKSDSERVSAQLLQR